MALFEKYGAGSTKSCNLEMLGLRERNLWSARQRQQDFLVR